MHSSKFAPKAGERHRAMVRSALSIYEESMGHYLGFGRAAEASEIESLARSKRRCNREQLRLVSSVVVIRNNESHFPGPAFGFGRAVDDVRSIANALDSFELTQSSARVRAIISEERGRSAPGRRYSTPRGVSPGWLGVLSGVAVFFALYLALNGVGVQQDAGTWSLVPALLVGVLVWIRQRRGRGS